MVEKKRTDPDISKEIAYCATALLELPDIFIDPFGAGLIKRAKFAADDGRTLQVLEISSIPYGLEPIGLSTFTVISTITPRDRWDRNRYKTFEIDPKKIVELAISTFSLDVKYDYEVRQVVRVVTEAHKQGRIAEVTNEDLEELSLLINRIDKSKHRIGMHADTFNGPNQDRDSAHTKLVEILLRERARRGWDILTNEDLELLAGSLI